MHDENRFFRWVWRVNGFLLLLLLLGVAAAGVCKLAWHGDRHMFAHWHHKMPAAHPAADAYSLVPNPSTDMQSAAPKAERLYALQKTVAGPVTRTINLLAVEDGDKSTHWLFKPAERAILAQAPLLGYEKQPPAEGARRLGLVGLSMVVAEADTNGDGQYTEDDRQTVYVYRFDAEPPLKVLTADRIISSHEFADNSRVHIVYQSGGKSIAATYSLPDFKLLSEIAVPGLPKLSERPEASVRVGLDPYAE